MKLTNDMRAYIEKKVKQRYALKLELAQKKVTEAYDKQRELEDTCRQLVAEYLSKTTGMNFDINRIDLTIRKPEGNWGSYQIPEILEANRKLNEIQELIREKHQDICMELALGGTKADLDRMLDKLDEELQAETDEINQEAC